VNVNSRIHQDTSFKSTRNSFVSVTIVGEHKQEIALVSGLSSS
jgi:hypothetical protein